MKKKWLVVAGLIVGLVIVGVSGCNYNPADTASTSGFKVNFGSQNDGIWVNGQGEVTVVPDIALLRLGVESQETSVAEAQSKAAAAMEKLTKALKDGGVAEKDIKTQHFSIQKVSRWDRDIEKEIIIGYRVSNTVLAKIREVEKTGTIIDAASAAGGDLTRINSISFSVDDPSEYYEEAREKAMRDAKAKANQLAELGGVKLGKPIYISEGASSPAPRPVFEKAAAGPAPALVETSISPGEMKISLNVQVVYAILN